ncbi:calcium/calmodulin dependent protein kinase [Leptodontidium sp. MPI-SDFR-AT-0119]|nr:calcium/calmodulin dependent protein kinase [Leptodontidium sp. MPI-SDFR-AT-0119]
MPPGDPARQEITEISSPFAEVVGQSGRHYLIKQVLVGTENFILKAVPASQFDYIQGIYRSLRCNPYLRLSVDAVPERSMFVYRYFADHLLSFAQKELPIRLTKRILKDSLRGLAALHDQNIVHTDVKANNILVDWENRPLDIAIKEVQLADIEDAAYVDPNSDIVGIQIGNLMWRSPEAHTQGRVNKPSDTFSFGIVCIYAVTKQVIFSIEGEDLGEGEEPLAVVLERQISYFADEEGLNGLLRHLGDSPWCQVLETLRDGFNKTNPRKPVSLWKGIDKDFRDLVTGLTKFDPSKRLTAKEALQHPWFGDVE